MRLVWAYLLVWIPVSFAFELLSALSSLAMRGLPAIVELAVHALVAGLSVAASRMLEGTAPARFTAAASAVAANGVVAIQSLYWTVLPRDIPPGSRTLRAVLDVAVMVFLLLLVASARRKSRETP